MSAARTKERDLGLTGLEASSLDLEIELGALIEHTGRSEGVEVDWELGGGVELERVLHGNRWNCEMEAISSFLGLLGRKN